MSYLLLSRFCIEQVYLYATCFGIAELCPQKNQIKSSFTGYSGMAKVKGYSEYDGLFKEVVNPLKL